MIIFKNQDEPTANLKVKEKLGGYGENTHLTLKSYIHS